MVQSSSGEVQRPSLHFLLPAQSLGKDKLAYAIFFIAFVLYNFSSLSVSVSAGLCVPVLWVSCACGLGCVGVPVLVGWDVWVCLCCGLGCVGVPVLVGWDVWVCLCCEAQC